MVPLLVPGWGVAERSKCPFSGPLGTACLPYPSIFLSFDIWALSNLFLLILLRNMAKNIRSALSGMTRLFTTCKEFPMYNLVLIMMVNAA